MAVKLWYDNDIGAQEYNLMKCEIKYPGWDRIYRLI